MQRLKILGLAVMAVLALSALVSATASATGPVILPVGAHTWTGESGAGTLSVLGGLEIKCLTDVSEGSFPSGSSLGLFHIHFEDCTSSGIPCSSLDHAVAEKTILSLGTAHLVWDLLSGGVPTGAGVLFLPETLHIVCESGIIKSLVVVSGQVLCLIKPITLAKHFEIVCEQTAAGDPKETVYWNAAGGEVKLKEALLTALNEGTGKGSAEKTTALILTPTEIELMT